MDRHVSTQEMFAEATKRSEEVSQPCPHAFDRVGVNFKGIILIVIACPLLVSMCNGRMLAFDAMIRLVFIGENMAVRPGNAMNMVRQGFGLCGVNHPQTDLPAGTSNRAQYRWTVVSVRASASPLVGSPTRWSVRRDTPLTFFPPHFGRVRHSQLPNRGQASRVVNVRRFVGVLAANLERSSSSVPTLRPVPSWSHLSGCRATAKPLVAV
jgi:hypothetical protein